jgi:HD-GYP domain-containing protein (c-di-GMP phosphodiesterase class II)
VAASFLSYTLVRAHTRAVEQDESVNATGEILAILSPGLEALATRSENDPQLLAQLREGVASGLRHQLVTGIRIYHVDGTPIYPKSAPADPSGVAHAVIQDNLSSREATSSDGLPIRIEYVPYASHGRIVAIVAIDLSLDEMRSQTAGEERIVILSTLGAVSIIFLALVAEAAGASRELERRRRQAEETFSQTLGVLADTLELRDPYTAGHSRRVAEYSQELGRALLLTKREIDIIGHAAMLHDLGKIGIPDSVLLSPSRLDERERTIITRHPVLGAQIIGGIASMEDVVPCVLHHHERIDGTGYPGHLVADAIPIGARVIAVADTFDAMTTDRPYRRALTVEVAVEELRRIAGTQLDPNIVRVFIEIVRAGKILPPLPAPEGAELIFGPKVHHLHSVS